MGGGSGLGMAGPLAVFAPGFSAELLRRGYRPRSAGEQLRLMADASEWLAGHGLGPCDLTEVRVAELMAGRRAAGRSHLLSVSGDGSVAGVSPWPGGRAGRGGEDVGDAERGADRALLGVSA